MDFHLTSKYKPTGDQPEAIRQLTDGLERGDQAQVPLGVTGSGKTFTIANVIDGRFGTWRSGTGAARRHGFW